MVSDHPIQYVKGVGPGRSKLLQRLDIKTIEDALYYLPSRYEDRRNIKKIRELNYGSLETTMGEVVGIEVTTTPRKGIKIFELTLMDSTGVLKAKWFNQPFMKQYFKHGQRVILSGHVKSNAYYGIGIEMESPEFEIIKDEQDRLIHTGRIVPIYRGTEGLSPKQLRTIMMEVVVGHIDEIKDFLPEEIRLRNSLMPLGEAIKNVHFPEDASIEELNRGVSTAHRRLIFDEFFILELGLSMIKRGEDIERGITFKAESPLVRALLERLPFKPTKAQERVFDEIRRDMAGPTVMNRLMHGDVGCGKTIVALMSMLLAVDSGYQAALMAPTEILAEQHYLNIHHMIEALGLKAALLTGSLKERPIQDIAEGSTQIVIGTHALIQEGISFKKLGLVIIDEQHRFGVIQRASLRKKGFNPDVLVMTATPIPRTLALTLYGDLDVSTIDELPPMRHGVETKVLFSSQKERIYSLMRQELEKGRQAYVVYPIIEGSEKVDLKSAIEGAKAFQQIFQRRNVGLIHGRMKPGEREEIMASFKAGKIDILVATTVIEVGVDVPNATVMVIVHAERFGLAQLHQLRGRVGRGGHQSYCLLVAYPPMGDEAKKRLKVMEETSDGFRIAEEDLIIRGPGDFFGTRQAGIPDLRAANLIRDIRILEAARREAFAITDKDPGLKAYPSLRDAIKHKWQGRIDLIRVS